MAEHDIGYLIKSINDKLKVKADEDLRQRKLTLSQSRIVGFLMQKGGTATQKEIEDFLEVSHPTVVGLVSRMAQNDMVHTRFDSNRRSKVVSLTEYAETIAKDMNDTIRACENTLLAGVSDEDVLHLKATLNAILKNLG